MRIRTAAAILVAVACLWGAAFGGGLLGTSVQSPAPAHTQIGGYSHDRPPATPVRANLDALYGSPCGVRLFALCPVEVPVWFNWQAEKWVLAVTYIYGPAAAGTSGFCNSLAGGVYVGCEYMLTFGHAYTDAIFMAYPNGVAMLFDSPGGQFVGYW